ncbi:MAG: PAS domain-containing protein [Planctomycetota bacterium]|nr:MAG: PAS domain-containing protein [Planctomycetota bacterium]
MDLDFHTPTPALCRAVNTANVGLFTLGADGCLRGWSDGAARLLGFSALDVVGAPADFLDADQPRLGIAELWRRLAAGEEFAEGRLTLRHREGHPMDVLADLRPFREAGRLVGAVGVLTDVTLLLQANQRFAEVLPPRAARRSFRGLVGESPIMQEVYERIELAAAVDVTVLIRGETGTGKELAAQAIHALSERRTRPLICVNCAAIPDPLLESELFGHVRGAFTGAIRDKRGVFEAANGGILFLDEIGDMGPSVQVKLLRALQEREIRRVGEDRVRKVDVRILSATHRDLAALVAAGQFREDLYYRLRVFELNMPPLRDREGDVERLILHFMEEFAARHGKSVREVSPEALACAVRYAWPGNVRELRNAVEHAFVTVRGNCIGLSDLPAEIRAAAGTGTRAEEAGVELPPPLGALPVPPSDERSRIIAALMQAGGKKAAAASLLGISRVTLWKKMKRLGISPVYGVESERLPPPDRPPRIS